MTIKMNDEKIKLVVIYIFFVISFGFSYFWNFRYPISPRVCACSQCGEVFPKLESLELHQAVRHAGKVLFLYSC